MDVQLLVEYTTSGPVVLVTVAANVKACKNGPQTARKKARSELYNLKSEFAAGVVRGTSLEERELLHWQGLGDVRVHGHRRWSLRL